MDQIRAIVNRFMHASTNLQQSWQPFPRSLEAEDRRTLLQELKISGLLEVGRETGIIAAHLSVAASLYSYAK
jgi:hypothetical protein